jgi:hypothetical protein
MGDLGANGKRDTGQDRGKPSASSAPSFRDLNRQVRLSLKDPRKLANVLGLLNGRSEKQARGVIVNCPAHGDRGRPNLSITTGPDGTARAKCHACDFSGDALTLVALVHGLDMKRDFKSVLVLAAELGGERELAAQIDDGKPRPDRIHIPEPRQLPEAPWADGVSHMWDSCLPISYDPEACAMLRGRGLSPERVEALNLARVLPTEGALPRWAHFGRRSWRETGHRIVVRHFAPDGAIRALRAWRVAENDTPKRLPPAGCKSAGLVLANRLGHGLLMGNGAPVLVIVEGEPDWLAATLAAPGGFAVWGIGSGSWSESLTEAAKRARRIVVATHPDAAGDRYASQVTGAICSAVRWKPPRDLDEIGEEELQGLISSCAKWLFVPHQLGD